MDDLPTLPDRPGEPVLPELRHLTAFQQVYLVRDYTSAGHDLNTDRKGVLRMMDRLEQAFRNPLFSEPRRGVLVPSPFADRLFNDLRLLNVARESLSEQVADIRHNSRPVRIGGSPIIFRSTIFRSVFRDLQLSGKMRATYVSVAAEEASKALASGTCDLHIGCIPASGSRLVSRFLGSLAFRMLERKGAEAGATRGTPWIVSSEEMKVEPMTGEITRYRPLEEAQFLHWMDHPEGCPAGTLILAPEIPVDGNQWNIIEGGPSASTGVHLRYLRQHPYEFLPTLANGIKIQITPP